MYSRKKLAQAVTPLWNYLQLLDIAFGEWLTESIIRDDDLKKGGKQWDEVCCQQ